MTELQFVKLIEALDGIAFAIKSSTVVLFIFSACITIAVCSWYYLYVRDDGHD